MSVVDTAPDSALAALADARALYDRGLYVQALHAGQQAAPLRRWNSTAGRLLAGRIAYNLGAPRLGRALHWLARRHDPTDPEAVYFHARAVMERRGLLEAWEWQEHVGDLPGAPSAIRADLHALRAHVLGQLRDFDAAEAHLAQAEALAPERPWVCIERSTLFELEDRYDDAVNAARRSLELRPGYRPGVQALAHALVLVGHDEEALELLVDSARRIESNALCIQLAGLQIELGRYADACDSLARATELSPLAEKEFSRWLAAMRARAEYFAGREAPAREFGRQAESAFFRTVEQRLEQAPADAKSVLLPVAFVRQHHVTCAPATMTAIAKYFQRRADHLELAEQICYDGTPNHGQRAWAEREGWRVREFTVTWRDAVALLDRGVPFAMNTVGPGRAHMQAVIGYDDRRGTLLVRDPYLRHVVEMIAEGLFSDQAAQGPRGMALVPAGESHRLDGLALTDAEHYDCYHEIQSALVAHDRDGARSRFEALRSEHPAHRLTLEARLSLASYDGDDAARLRCVEELLDRFPRNPTLTLSKLGLLTTLGRQQDRVVPLETMCREPGCDPIFWQQYAQELMDDARRHDEATRLLRRAVRARPDMAGAYYSLAGVHWRSRDFAAALALYRFAACLEDKNENLALSYFSAARHTGAGADALAMLRARFERFGRKSSFPARTLCTALETMGRAAEALALLDQAIALRPQDGALLLHAAGVRQRYADDAGARELLERARPCSQRSEWLRGAAGLARQRGALDDALRMYRAVLETEPLAIDAHHAVARLLAGEHGRAMALEHLRRACDAHPKHWGLHQLWVEWLRDEDLPEHERVVRRLIAINPVDTWARRELALVLKHAHRFDEARQEAELAIALSPNQAINHVILARVERAAGRREQAVAALWHGLKLQIDAEGGLELMLSLAATRDERRRMLLDLRRELLDQVLYGEALLAWRRIADDELPAEDVGPALETIQRTRPDLWQAWHARLEHLIDHGELDSAEPVLREAVERFPHTAELHVLDARIAYARSDAPREAAALARALALQPDHAVALSALAGAHRRRGDVSAARELYEQAVARDPLNAPLTASLAEVLWECGERDAAVERMRQALHLEPGLVEGWNDLQRWTAEIGQPEAARQYARELAQRRPSEARSWLIVARVLNCESDEDERLAALERALSLEPSLVEPRDLRAELLAAAGRFEEALDACKPTPAEGVTPLPLRGRAAAVRWSRGEHAAAIEAMSSLVAEEPNYAWGWQCLLEWAAGARPPAELVQFAERFAAAQSRAPLAHAWVGFAQLRAGDAASARSAFERALALDPHYVPAAEHLFDLALADRRFDDARRSIDALREAGQAESARLRTVQLSVAAGRDDDAREAFRELVRSPDCGESPIQSAVESFVDARKAALAFGVLLEELDAGRASPALARVWAAHMAPHMPHGDAWRRLMSLCAASAAGFIPVAGYIEALTERRKHWRLRWIVFRHGRLLHNDDHTWSAVAWALLDRGALAAARRWTRDHAARPNLTPYMLLAPALVLRQLGRSAQAACINERAVVAAGAPFTFAHVLLLALDDALADRRDAARGRLAHVAALELPPFYDYLRRLAVAVLECADSTLEPRDRLRRAKSALREADACFPDWRRSPLHRKARSAAASAMARRIGGWSAWFFAFLRSHP